MLSRELARNVHGASIWISLAILLQAYSPQPIKAQEAELWGTVRDAETQGPIPAEVSIIHPEGPQGQLFHARAEANGWYHALSLPPGRKIVIARADGFGFAFQELSLEAGQHLGPLDLELKPEATIKGFVVTDSGQPLEGATVRVIYPDAPQAVFGWMMSETVTNSDGQFQASVSPYRECYLESSHSNFPVRFFPRSFSLEPGAQRTGIRLSLFPGISLVGQVKDVIGNPIVSAQVMLIARQLPVPDPTNGKSLGLQQETHRRATTDSQGGFSFNGLGNGLRLLLVRHPNYETKQEKVILNRALAPEMEIEVTLVPASQ